MTAPSILAAPSVKVVLPGEGETGGLAPGVGVQFKLDGADSLGALAIVEHPFAVGALVPPHIHTREDEFSIVTEGRIGFRSNDQEVVLEAGGYIVKPRGEVHAMWNAGKRPARMIEVIAPGRVRGLLPRDGGDDGDRRVRLVGAGEAVGGVWPSVREPRLAARRDRALRPDASAGAAFPRLSPRDPRHPRQWTRDSHDRGPGQPRRAPLRGLARRAPGRLLRVRAARRVARVPPHRGRARVRGQGRRQPAGAGRARRRPGAGPQGDAAPARSSRRGSAGTRTTRTWSWACAHRRDRRRGPSGGREPRGCSDPSAPRPSMRARVRSASAGSADQRERSLDAGVGHDPDQRHEHVDPRTPRSGATSAIGIATAYSTGDSLPFVSLPIAAASGASSGWAREQGLDEHEVGHRRPQQDHAVDGDRHRREARARPSTPCRTAAATARTAAAGSPTAPGRSRPARPGTGGGGCSSRCRRPRSSARS